MHGRARLDRPPSAQEIEADQQKSAAYCKLVSIIHARRSADDFSEPTLELTGQLLRKNPDYYTLWNFRREILIKNNSGMGLEFNKMPVRINDDAGSAIAARELQLSQDAIVKNPKSYGAWYHRVWIIDRFVVDIDHEIGLCNKFLEADQRNFHCWNYRRHLITIGNIPARSEFEFSTKKISENFSNYSAFHHRSVYMKSLLAADDGLGEGMDPTHLQAVLQEEYSIIESAVFTEPDDQSAWWYYHFLIHIFVTRVTAASGNDPDTGSCSWLLQEVLTQKEAMSSLHEIEPSSKWVLMAVIMLIDAANSLLATVHSTTPSGSGTDLTEERAAALAGLCEMDSRHRRCYLHRLGQH